MKSIFFLAIFINALSIKLYPQNVVSNFSFELADSCPVDVNINGVTEYSLGCKGWGQATLSTPDYFNSCDTAAVSIGKSTPNVGVPLNGFGSQAAFEGFAYSGAILYGPDTSYKEYLITHIPPLDTEANYRVTLHVSLAENSSYAIDGIGVLFTTYGRPNLSTKQTLNYIPQIDYTDFGIISDPIHWTTLSSTFIPDSAYTSLIIGVFKYTKNMNILNINADGNQEAYYYIDNVVVEKLSDNFDVKLPTAFTPNSDGNNDIFYAHGNHIKTITLFRIYNRWGNIMFERTNIDVNDKNKGWDGTYKGGYANSDVYSYVISAISENGKTFTSKGYVTLIR